MEKEFTVQPNNNQIESELTNKKITYVVNQSDSKEELSQPQATTVLVADDDLLYFSFIESILSSSYYNLIHAKDGQEAVDIHRSNKDIKLILMDIQMPEMDGYTATKEIRKSDQEVPIIVQTSFSSSRIKDRAYLSGCNDFLLKPVDPEVLVNKIESFIKPTEQSLTR